jgi:DNA polymerase III subunit delta
LGTPQNVPRCITENMAVTSPKSLPPLVLIHGDDDFAVKQRALHIYQQWSAELGGMDHETIDAQVGNSGEALKALAKVFEALQTLPFFGGGKAVWLKNCNFLGDERAATAQAVTESLTDLAQMLKTFQWQSTRLLISAGKVDKRKAFYKTLEKLGAIEHFPAWSMDEKDWAVQAEMLAEGAINAAKKKIAPATLSELVQNVGPNRRELTNEVEKLVLYVGNRDTIEPADVRAVVTRHKQARAFALGDALGERDLPRLLRTLDEELWEIKLDNQKSEIGLLYGLISKVRAMIFLREMMQEGWVRANSDYSQFKNQLQRVPVERFSEDKKFNPLAQNPFMLYKALGHANKYSSDELIDAMSLLLECNQRLVLSSLDESLVLQQALVQIVRGNQNSGTMRTQKY